MAKMIKELVSLASAHQKGERICHGAIEAKVNALIREEGASFRKL